MNKRRKKEILEWITGLLSAGMLLLGIFGFGIALSIFC